MRFGSADGGRFSGVFCPECKAEYHPGFTHCVDCDVDLVAVSPATVVAKQVWETAAIAGNYTSQLWRGGDPHFYLALLSSLWTHGIACLGRPPSPPVLSADGASSYRGVATPSFEILVPERALPLAGWVLNSAREKYDDGEKLDGATPPPPAEPRQEAVSECSLCSAEFAPDAAACPNCGVPLKLSYGKSPFDPSSRLLCSLPHPRFNYAIRDALTNAGVAFNNASHFGRDMILGRSNVPSDYVVVPDQDYDRASGVLAQVLQHWEFEPGSGFENPPPNPLQSYWPARASANGWLPEDLTTIAWTGSNLGTLSQIAWAFREHEIPYAVDVSWIGTGKLMVHREDEAGSREIAAQVAENTPPAEV